MLRSKVIAQIRTTDLENELNKFMRENGIDKDSVVNMTYNNGVVFLCWDDHNADYLQQLNSKRATVDPKYNGGGSKESATYIESGCE